MASIKSDKLWAGAVRKAVHEYHEEKDENGKVKKIRHLNRIAQTLVQSAGDGDIQAMKEVGDRLDGKPAQAIVGDPDNPIIREIRHVVVDPRNTDS